MEAAAARRAALRQWKKDLKRNYMSLSGLLLRALKPVAEWEATDFATHWEAEHMRSSFIDIARDELENCLEELHLANEGVDLPIDMAAQARELQRYARQMKVLWGRCGVPHLTRRTERVVSDRRQPDE
jgi:hypothetical protein